MKFSLFVNDMIVYIEDPMVSMKKILEVIQGYSKVAGYKINIQKSIAFLYKNSRQTELELKKVIPFTIATKKYKIPRDKSNQRS